MAAVRLAQYQQTLAKGYNRRVQPREFKIGDLVLRKVVGSQKDPTEGNLGPNWESPYKVTSIAIIEAYRLEDMNEKAILRP